MFLSCKSYLNNTEKIKAVFKTCCLIFLLLLHPNWYVLLHIFAQILNHSKHIEVHFLRLLEGFYVLDCLKKNFFFQTQKMLLNVGLEPYLTIKPVEGA